MEMTRADRLPGEIGSGSPVDRGDGVINSKGSSSVFGVGFSLAVDGDSII